MAVRKVKEPCANCGKMKRLLMYFEGKLYCPGACDVGRASAPKW